MRIAQKKTSASSGYHADAMEITIQWVVYEIPASQTKYSQRYVMQVQYQTVQVHKFWAVQVERFLNLTQYTKTKTTLSKINRAASTSSSLLAINYDEPNSIRLHSDKYKLFLCVLNRNRS